MSIFLSAYEESQNFSHFANIIINNYLLNSPVALTQYAAKEFEKYSMLADDISDDIKNKLLSLAVGSHAAGLLSYPKGERKKIKVTTDSNLSYLVIPYTIKADSLSNYNYLIGLSFENNNIPLIT